MFSLFKKKGKSRAEQTSNDFAHAKGAIKKGEKLTARDKRMIAVGRTQVHLQNNNDFKYNLSKIDKGALERDVKHLEGDLAYVKKYGTDMSGKKKNKADINFMEKQLNDSKKLLAAKKKSKLVSVSEAGKYWVEASNTLAEAEAALARLDALAKNNSNKTTTEVSVDKQGVPYVMKNGKRDYSPYLVMAYDKEKTQRDMFGFDDSQYDALDYEWADRMEALKGSDPDYW